MYYSSSESSDSDTVMKNPSLDFSFLSLDSQTMSLHLKNSVLEQNDHKTCQQKDYKNKRLHDKDSSQLAVNNICSNSNEQLYDSVTEKLYLQHNVIQTLPFELTLYVKLKFLDLSNNNLLELNSFLICLVNIQTLYLKNNELSDDSLPKDLSGLSKLKELNLSGNYFTRVPAQVYELTSLKYLYLGNNSITEIDSDVKNLQKLQTLHLGGNALQNVPDELGQLSQLSFLALCDNRLRRLPRAISKLTCLRSLLIHKNNLCCLPVEIVTLGSLNEISLRDNPLVNKFVDCCAKEIIHTPPSLLELAARVIKLKDIKYHKTEIPVVLHEYINSGKKCVNPNCKGVYFTSCVEHVKFVDFCGKYRLPLMHYLCSTRCSSTTPSFYKTRNYSESDEDESNDTLKKVLLG